MDADGGRKPIAAAAAVLPGAAAAEAVDSAGFVPTDEADAMAMLAAAFKGWGYGRAASSRLP